MLKIANLSENLLILVNMAEENKVVSGSIFGRTINLVKPNSEFRQGLKILQIV